MSRIVIELKPETHRRLKSAAVLKGKTIKDYILWSVGLVALEKGVEK